MPEKTFTPGPWFVNEDTACVYHVETEGHEPPICDTQGIDICEKPFDEALANAKLIAAAPDMLEVLEDSWRVIADLCNGAKPDTWVMKRIEQHMVDAIAKAKA